jgi:phage terminase large subunit-like protein
MRKPALGSPEARARRTATWPTVVRDGIDYAEGVVAGRLIAGRHVVLACRRFLADLDATTKPRSRWDFDPALAVRPIHFAELLPNIKGPLAGQTIKTMAWQRWIIINLFGFVDRRSRTRRFRQGSVWVPRGNGKSSLAAALAIYATFMEGEGGAEGYAAAVTRDQARIVWDTAKEMVDRTPVLRARFGVETSKHSIFKITSASKFVSISSDAKSLDGLNVHFAVCDEIGSHRSANVYDVLLTALGKRRQPLLVSISTATGNNAGIGKKVHDYAQRVLDGVIRDDRFFAVIYAADPGDPVWEEATWRKANPGWGVTVQPDAIQAIANQAKASPAQEIAFKTRHLNLWVSADSSLFSLEAWRRCADTSMRLQDFEGRRCWIGLDLSAKVDLTAASLIFPLHEPGEPERYAIFSRCWLPESTIASSRNPSYPGWVKEGALIATEGEVTDYEVIEDTLRDWCARFDVEAIGYDPWSARQLSQRLLNEGLPMVEVRQTVMNLSEPTKTFDALMRGRRLRHNGDPVLAWCVACVVGRRDEKDNVFPKKEKNSDGKVDAAIATIIALALAGSKDNETTVVTQPFLVL